MNALTDSDTAKLTAKYQAFRKIRDDLSIFLVSFISDYMRLLHDEPPRRKRYLRRKYGSFTPRINYQFNTGEGFCWSVRNIAIVLGRDRSSIIRVLSRMRRSDYWSDRVSPLHSIIMSYEGGHIDVYEQEIFDVMLDYYEEEYLQRFARPRHGDITSAPSIDDLRNFWMRLRSQEYVQKRVFLPTDGEGIQTFTGCALPHQKSLAGDTWLRKIIDWLRRLMC